MAKQQPIEIFMPPNMLKAKVGGGAGGLDLSAIKRAEAAIEELKEEFAGWIVEDMNKLTAARDAFAAHRTADTFGTLYRAAHDLKGQGATFDFPLVARVAASLCKFTDGAGTGEALPLNLIDAHVDAIKIIVRDKIKNPSDDRTANVLAAELESQVKTFLETP
jgi:chemotaxis protein histidine kinase CheA